MAIGKSNWGGGGGGGLGDSYNRGCSKACVQRLREHVPVHVQCTCTVYVVVYGDVKSLFLSHAHKYTIWKVTHTHTHLHVHIHVYTHTYMYTHTHTYMYTHTYNVHVHSHTHTHIHTHTSTCTHTHTHTPSAVGPSGGCFFRSDSLCGNNLLDDGEDCDCGPDINQDGICIENVCCNGTSCLLNGNVECRYSVHV